MATLNPGLIVTARVLLQDLFGGVEDLEGALREAMDGHSIPGGVLALVYKVPRAAAERAVIAAALELLVRPKGGV